MRYAARVVRGRGDGRRIGIPTLNLEIPPDLDAGHGIYAGRVHIHGREYAAVFHFGPVPTFRIATPSLEAHLLDAALQEPPPAVEFELAARLRDVEHFETTEALVARIEEDIRRTRTLLNQKPAH